MWEARQERQNQLRKDEVRKRYWVSSRVPQRHAALGSQSWRADAEPGQVQAFLTARKIIDKHGIVALIGARGVGKTQIAVELIREAAHQVKRCAYYRAQEAFGLLRSCYGPSAERRERDVIAELTDPWLLVLDDMHDRGHTEAESRFLTLILDRRYGDLHPTVLIANASPDEFRGEVGESIYDRLAETGGWIDCQWPSHRAKE